MTDDQKLKKNPSDNLNISSGSLGDVRRREAVSKAAKSKREPKGVNIQNSSGDDSPNSQRINTETAPYHEAYNLGEQSVSGSSTDPTSDDDTLKNAHLVGQQAGEDDQLDNPQEINIADDIDKAEEKLKDS